jgi:hypothetical protein
VLKIEKNTAVAEIQQFKRERERERMARERLPFQTYFYNPI